MINDPVLQHLVNGGTRQFLTAWQKVERVLSWVLLVGFLVLVAGYFADKEATNSVAACTNTQLAARNSTSADDEAAHLAWATAIEALLAVPSDSTPAQQLIAVNIFVRQTEQYRSTLAADQAFRISHPLGKC